MTAACEGYACPPEHSVPASTVIVVRHEPDLAATGAQFDPTLTIAGSAAIIIGAILLGRRATNNRSSRD